MESGLSRRDNKFQPRVVGPRSTAPLTEFDRRFATSFYLCQPTYGFLGDGDAAAFSRAAFSFVACPLAAVAAFDAASLVR
jgi:hypothetical protein